MPTPTLGYENVARIQPKKRLPAADGGQCLSMYFFSGTSELGPQPPCRRILDIAMSSAFASDAAPARMQCSTVPSGSGRYETCAFARAPKGGREKSSAAQQHTTTTPEGLRDRTCTL